MQTATDLPLLLLLCASLAAAAAAGGRLVENQLPDVLLKPPIPLRPSHPRLSSATVAQQQLRQKPRVVAGYLSDAPWAFTEFLTMTFASWMHLSQLSQAEGLGSAPHRKIDLLVFADDKWRQQLGSICQALDLSAAHSAGYQGTFTQTSQCFAVLYPVPPDSIWHGYPFINNVHFFADPLVAHFFENYGYGVCCVWGGYGVSGGRGIWVKCRGGGGGEEGVACRVF